MNGVGVNNNIVQGNRIGTNADVTTAIPNTFRGVAMFAGASNNTVGGAAAGARNILSGNNTSGIVFSGLGTNGNVASGNFIGTNATGTAAIPNGAGVVVQLQAANNTIGGPQVAERNVISGNSQMGVQFVNAGTTGNRVLGNFIGTNATGTGAVPNGAYGVDVSNTAGGNMIGGEQTGEGNVISGNSLSGVASAGPRPTPAPTRSSATSSERTPRDLGDRQRPHGCLRPDEQQPDRQPDHDHRQHDRVQQANRPRR